MHLLQVYYTKDNESRKKMIQLEEFLARLRYRWIEKTVFTRTNDKFTAALGLDERSPASLIVFVISKYVHMAGTRSYLTVNDGKQIKDMLSEYNDRVCCCVPTSAATSNDAINIDKGPR